jgi:hypothetical protein
VEWRYARSTKRNAIAQEVKIQQERSMAIKSKTFTVEAAVMRRFSEGREYKFKLHGAQCRCRVVGGKFDFEYPLEIKYEFEQLMNALTHFGNTLKSIDLDCGDINKFLYKHFRMSAEIMETMRRALSSETASQANDIEGGPETRH